jgi:cysteine-rich repeat protein
MKRLIAIALFLAAGAVSAADLTVTVPSAAVPKAVEMCEVLRGELRVRASEWSNDLCATIFTRIGMSVYVGRVERRGATQTVDDAVQAEIDLFDANWARPYTPARCGDGTLDEEFGEECDDGNNDNGDGCNFKCLIEP